jgi:lipopolysaccharide biosynthesis regulator YciM
VQPSLEPPFLIAAAAVAVAIMAGYTTFSRRRRSADAARAYLKGFRYILSDEPDAALEELTRAVEVDARTVETYFALGALFRRTGEHERAIRLHQNMLLKSDLQERLARQIELELALDYHRAGMLQQAGETYQKLLSRDPTHREALTRLRQIHEERQDYPLAAEVQARLVEAQDGSRAILAHLLAEAALAENDMELARGFAARAVEIEPSSAHAALALGLVLARRGQGEEAAASLKRACELDPEMCVRAAEPLQQVCDADGPRGAIPFLEALVEAGDHASARVALARCLRQTGRVGKATAHLRRALDLDPRYVEARVELGKALLESSMDDGARRELEALLAALGQQETSFSCRACGHGYSEPQFRCVRCLNWDTIKRGTPAKER